MANIKSAQKYIRQTETRTARNRSELSRLRTLAKKVAASTEDADAARAAAVAYSSALDKAAKRGVIHTNRANRQKAAIAKHIFAAAK